MIGTIREKIGHARNLMTQGLYQEAEPYVRGANKLILGIKENSLSPGNREVYNNLRSQARSLAEELNSKAR